MEKLIKQQIICAPNKSLEDVLTLIGKENPGVKYGVNYFVDPEEEKVTFLYYYQVSWEIDPKNPVNALKMSFIKKNEPQAEKQK